MRLFIPFLLFLLIGCSQTVEPLPSGAIRPVLQVELVSNWEKMSPGSSGTVSFLVSAEDPDKVLNDAVVFVTVNRELGDDKYIPSVGQDLFAYMNANPNIFQTVLKGSDLRKGINVKIDYQLKKKVPLGPYTVNFQLFHGRITDPNAVELWHRLGTKNFGFEITE